MGVKKILELPDTPKPQTAVNAHEMPLRRFHIKGGTDIPHKIIFHAKSGKT
jgi:hypothetical protein